MKPGSRSTLDLFFLIFFFSSSLVFLLYFVLLLNTKNQQGEDAQQLGRGREVGCTTRWGVWDAKGEEKGRERKGMGTFYGVCGLLVGCSRDFKRGPFK